MSDSRAKITFLCRQDFANVSTETARALREHSTRYDARVISMGPHPYGYATPHDFDLTCGSAVVVREASAFLEESTTIIWAEEPNVFGGPFSAYGKGSGLDVLLAASAKKRRLVFHAGVAFRDASARYNTLDAGVFAGQLCSPDLLRLARPGARCVWAKPMAVDFEEVDRLWRARRATGKIVVTHSPSSHVLKGTEMVRKVMARIERSFPNVEYRELGGPVGGHVPHHELMRAREEAVLHIDQYHAGIGGVGIASFEALARGVIPLASTNNVIDAAYEQWGLRRATSPIVPLVFDGQAKANEKQAERALVRIVSDVVHLPLEKLEARGRAAAEWLHTHLSPEPFVRSWEKQLDALGAGGAARRAS
jgi:hypothetical protein